MNDKHRGTGRTHRQLEWVAKEIGDAGRFLFVVAGPSVDHAVEIAQKVFAWRGVETQYLRARRVLVFPKHPFAELAFVSEDDFREGIHLQGTGRRVVIDHAARPRAFA